MGTMPRATYSVANLPFLLAFTDRYHCTDDFVARDAREGRSVPEGAGREETVRVADSAGVDLDEDFVAGWGGEGDGGDGPGGGGAGFIEDHGAVGFGEGWWGRHG